MYIHIYAIFDEWINKINNNIGSDNMDLKSQNPLSNLLYKFLNISQIIFSTANLPNNL